MIDYLDNPPQRYAVYLGDMVESSEGEYVKFADMDLYMFEGAQLMARAITRLRELETALSDIATGPLPLAECIDTALTALNSQNTSGAGE